MASALVAASRNVPSPTTDRTAAHQRMNHPSGAEMTVKLPMGHAASNEKSHRARWLMVVSCGLIGGHRPVGFRSCNAPPAH